MTSRLPIDLEPPGYLPMRRTALSLVFAGLLGLAGPATARADLQLTTDSSQISGTTTDYTTVGTQTLPYTDVYGRTVDALGDINFFDSNVGIELEGDTVTFSNLSAGTTELGVWLNGDPTRTDFVSASVSNGDSVQPPTSIPIGSSVFLGFTDSRPFTSITLNFSGDLTYYITDFRAPVGSATAVPEPSTVATGGVVLACAAAAGAWRHRRARPGERDR
jgi:hypothetical protein